MEKTQELLSAFSPLMTISGFEQRETEALCALLARFPEHKTDAYGNHYFYLRGGKPDLPLLLLDTHYDEIGMMVTELLEGGFVRITSVGGIDAHVLPASKVYLYPAKGEPIPAVVVSTPPHLQTAGESDKLLPVKETLVDTGMPLAELSALVSVGTPVGFAPVVSLLGGDAIPVEERQICGKALDNKACVVAAIRAAEMLLDEGVDMPCDLCLALSAKEEMGHRNMQTVAASVRPDAAIVLDVTFGEAPDVEKADACAMYGGPVLSLAAILSKRLTRAVRGAARDAEIPLQLYVDGQSTGTNANELPLCGEGIPCALVSIPLKSMHTPSEVVAVSDVYQTARLLAAFVKGGLEAWNS